MMHWLRPSFCLAEWVGVCDVLQQHAALVHPWQGAMPPSLAQARMAQAGAAGGTAPTASAPVVTSVSTVPASAAAVTDLAVHVDVAHALEAGADSARCGDVSPAADVGVAQTLAARAVAAALCTVDSGPGDTPPDPRGLCSGTDSSVGDGGVAVLDGRPDMMAGVVSIPSERLYLPPAPGTSHTEPRDYPLADPADSIAAARAAAADAHARDGVICRTVHGDVLMVRPGGVVADVDLDPLHAYASPAPLHVDIALCGFMLQAPLRTVRAGDGMPAAFPHLPHPRAVLAAPDYLATFPGGCFTTMGGEAAGEECVSEEDGEEVGGEYDRAGEASGWTEHERRLLASLGPAPRDGTSPAEHAAVARHSARYAALLRDDPPVGLSGVRLWAGALQASHFADAAEAFAAAPEAEPEALLLTDAQLEARLAAQEEDRLDAAGRAHEREMLVWLGAVADDGDDGLDGGAEGAFDSF